MARRWKDAVGRAQDRVDVENLRLRLGADDGR